MVSVTSKKSPKPTINWIVAMKNDSPAVSMDFFIFLCKFVIVNMYVNVRRDRVAELKTKTSIRLITSLESCIAILPLIQGIKKTITSIKLR